MTTRDAAGESRVRRPSVLRDRAFAVLFSAETQSVAGDQLARVALSVLVFDRTGSAALTASVYAVTYLPAILGGLLLAGLGDRFRKRRVMVACDVVRAALFAAMALPGLPVGAVAALLAVAVFVGPAFTSAEVSYLSAVLDGERFRAATGLRMAAGQVSQVAGFAFGGVVVAALGPRPALLVDAATFALSALLITVLLRPSRGRHHHVGTSGARLGAADEPVAGTHADGAAGGPARLLRTPGLVPLLGLSALAGLFVVPEGLAAPFAAEIDATTGQLGLLMAALPLGGTVGIVVLLRVVRRWRPTATVVMAIGCGVPLVVSALGPSWGAAVALWSVSGFCAAYQVEVVSTMVRLVPVADRSGLVGLGTSVLLGAQGIGLVVFGVVADHHAAGSAIAAAGALGAVVAAVLTPFARRHLSVERSGPLFDASPDGPGAPAGRVGAAPPG